MTRADDEITHQEDVGRVPRRRGVVNGTLLVLLGLWGVLIPLIGPYLGLAYGSNTPWMFTADRLLLSFLPGLLVVLGGLGLIATARSAGGVLWGWLAALGGAWFILGPTVSSMWHGGQPAVGEPVADSAVTAAVTELVHYLGLGTLIVFLASVALGRFTAGTGRRVVEVPEQHRAMHDDTRIVQDGAEGRHRAGGATEVTRDEVYEQGARDEARHENATDADEHHHRRGWLGLGSRR